MYCRPYAVCCVFAVLRVVGVGPVLVRGHNNRNATWARYCNVQCLFILSRAGLTRACTPSRACATTVRALPQAMSQPYAKVDDKHGEQLVSPTDDVDSASAASS